MIHCDPRTARRPGHDVRRRLRRCRIGVVDWLESLTGDVAITSVTLAELLAGVRRLPYGRRKEALTARIEAALEPYRGSRSVLHFDDLAADRYADVLVARESAGSPISTADAQIAAIWGSASGRASHGAGRAVDARSRWHLVRLSGLSRRKWYLSMRQGDIDLRGRAW
ncbi:PIN domain-containing protein [Arthrobacter castelli]|uniref:PIN domain-containing protein n=1 Tax=Arthrobacter castelli TaxID=271431 RepID=UPI001FDF9C11|nr:PIN domain-containing protein [Arthrobacter castelli]